MILVITNSRRFATDKLLSAYGLKPPFPGVRFIDRPDDLPLPFTDPDGPTPALIIWQRGRLSGAAKQLRSLAEEAFKIGSFRDPTPQDMET